MSINARIACIFLASMLLIPQAWSQQQPSQAIQPGDSRIYLDVVVTPKSGPPVSGLQQQDFKILDNKVPQPIASFQAFSGSNAPVEVILVVDGVNTSYQTVAYERSQIENFLRANGGHLAHPTTLAIVTDTETKIQNDYSKDGNALSAALENYVVSLRVLNRSSGFYGAAERFQISLQALQSLAAREAARPGRKIILWVSPGWPLLSGPRVELDPKQQQQLFAAVANLSTQLRLARVTLYSIDPRGTSDIGINTFYYQTFVKGVRMPSQVVAGDLGLQVIATQTGGLVLNSSNDVASLLQRCVADTESYYELSFDPTPGEHDEYHQLELQVAKPGLAVRTRQGYYSQP